jgi:hypothetical protein
MRRAAVALLGALQVLGACRAEKPPPVPLEGAPAASSASVEVRHDPPPPALKAQWVELHYAGWTMEAFPPSSLDLEGVTDLVLFGVVPDKGLLDASAGQLGVDKIARAVKHARAAGVRVHLCLGGEKSGARFRDIVPGEISDRVDRFGFDGIELDIEPLAEISDAKLAEIVHGLRRPQRTLAMVVLPREDEVARLAPLATAIDRVSLMGYVDRISPAREAELVAALTRARFPKERIGVGRDARTVAIPAGDVGGVLLWEANALCKDRPRPCAPARPPVGDHEARQIPR